MKRIFQGQVLKLDEIEHDFLEFRATFNPESASKIHQDTISRECFILKSRFFRVPELGTESSIVTLNYYRIITGTPPKYREFTVTPNRIDCVKTEVYLAVSPVSFKEFTKNEIRYLALDTRTEGPFELSIEKGVVVKDGCFYKVFGEGGYIFRAEGITYKFSLSR